ncbi:hypothetical protein [Cohnella terricola]|uniref:hypothetical protein n=1 Tax=Cohnella terricola TaxID=1289167 RepID=UPI001647D41E|nr:hypothetical protein [Cohnella terricola]
MANNRQQLSKAEVQTTPLNKMPVPGEDEVGFTAEDAAEVFEQNGSANRIADHQGERE